jgi:uncharacterized protein (TIGR02246 family)
MRTVIRLIRHMPLLFLPVGASFLVAAAHQELPGINDEPPEADERPAELRTQMDTLHQKYVQAYNRHDGEALGRLYTEDAILVAGDGREIRGRENIVSFFEQTYPQMPRITLEPLETGGHGDVGWEYGQFTVEGAPTPPPGASQPKGLPRPGERVTQQGHYVVVTAHEAGRGQIRLQVTHPGERPSHRSKPPAQQRSGAERDR